MHKQRQIKHRAITHQPQHDPRISDPAPTRGYTARACVFHQRNLGHVLTVAGPRTSTFGFGQAVMSTPQRVQSGASDPRHDGAAVPQVLAPEK